MNLNSVIENAMINETRNLDNLTPDERSEYEKVLQELAAMNKQLKLKQLKKEVLKVHPYAINHTDTSGWFTRIKPTESNPKEKIRLKNEEDFFLALAKHYQIVIEAEKYITLTDLYNQWYQRKSLACSPETMKRYAAIWKAYYDNDKEPESQKLINKPVIHITKKELRDWAELLMFKHKPNYKKYSNMFSIIAQLYAYAAQEDIDIGDSYIWEKARKMINRHIIDMNEEYEDEYTLSERQTFTDAEILYIQQEVRKDLVHYEKQASSAGLQILLLIETAMRIGEACGLKWEDVDFEREILHIRRQANNERVKRPKTRTSARTIPLTKEAINILNEVKAFNLKHGFDREWVFQSNNPQYEYRLSYNAADRKLRKLCARIAKELSSDKEVNIRSPHKLRKTTLSLLCDSVNSKTAQYFAGHKDASTTEKYYHFDRNSKEEQFSNIRQAICFTKSENTAS